MSWTEERVSILTRLWAEGLSASQIAGELGGVTRNAVIGKVHRLGLSGRAKSNAGTTRAKKSTKTTQPKVAKATSTKSKNTVALRTPASAPATTRDVDVVAPKSLELSLEKLTEFTCKWPSGDPAGDDFSFCGARTSEDGPYCEYHAKLAYQPMADRRRQRRSAAG